MDEKQTWKGILGIWSRSSSRRRQGHSCRKRRATSKVAPPHTSREAAFFMMCEVAAAAFSMSCDRMRVANRLWCASRLQPSFHSHFNLRKLSLWMISYIKHHHAKLQLEQSPNSSPDLMAKGTLKSVCLHQAGLGQIRLVYMEALTWWCR